MLYWTSLREDNSPSWSRRQGRMKNFPSSLITFSGHLLNSWTLLERGRNLGDVQTSSNWLVSQIMTSPTEAEGKRAFAELRPFCVQVMSSPSLESLAELRDKVSHLPIAIHPHLLDYILLPVRALLKRYGRLVWERERKIELAVMFSHYQLLWHRDGMLHKSCSVTILIVYRHYTDSIAALHDLCSCVNCGCTLTPPQWSVITTIA